MNSPPKKIYFVTGNKKKWEEVKLILGPHLPNALDTESLDLPEIQGTIEEIAIYKCKYAVNQLSSAVIVEDTALVFDEMNGMPGPYIKWFLDSLRLEKLSLLARSFSTALIGQDPCKARAICTMAYCSGPNEEPILFQGVTQGSISSPKGPENFGWDPIFVPEGHTQTYAEMSKEQKNSVSHRFRALDKLIRFFSH
jgi:inosine triphosphate pyrophosphatase